MFILFNIFRKARSRKENELKTKIFGIFGIFFTDNKTETY